MQRYGRQRPERLPGDADVQHSDLAGLWAPALLGLAVRRTPPMVRTGLVHRGLILGMLGAFVYHWSLIQQVAYYHSRIFWNFLLQHAVRSWRHSWASAVVQKPEYACRRRRGVEGFAGFYGSCVSLSQPNDICIGVLSLFLLFAAPADQRITVLLFALLTLGVGGSLYFVRGQSGGRDEPGYGRRVVGVAG